MPEQYVHSIRVRYGDCDMQGVVFNANYLSYLDDVIDQWFTAALGADYLSTFEYLVKSVSLDWSSPATAGEVIEARPAVSRWGRTSFDVDTAMRVGDRLIVEARLVGVSIAPGTHDPAPVPDHVRAALGG